MELKLHIVQVETMIHYMKIGGLKHGQRLFEMALTFGIILERKWYMHYFQVLYMKTPVEFMAIPVQPQLQVMSKPMNFYIQ